jgi:tRNA(fMet)-specific endonuclease VapC
LSSISVAELYFGVAKSGSARNLGALEQFLEPLEIADFDRPAAAAYGSLRAALEANGTPIDPLDTQIAAHALALGVTLVSNNTKEFARVPGLRLANWAQPR